MCPAIPLTVLAKPMSKTILAIGAHPDDIEFGCGGILCRESERGARIQMLVCSRGESGSNGDAATRTEETIAAASLISADLHWLELGGDGNIEYSRPNCVEIARVIRALRPSIVFAPTVVENQHPDHVAVGRIARDAARLARYGGLDTLKEQPPHAIESLCYYAVTPGSEPGKEGRVVVDLGESVETWKGMMRCHASQMLTRRYHDLQVARSHALGLEIGSTYAQAFWPADSLVVDDLSQLPKGGRAF